MWRLRLHAFEMEDGGFCKPVRINESPIFQVGARGTPRGKARAVHQCPQDAVAISSCSNPSLKLLLSPPDLIQASQDQTNVNVPQMVDTLMERVGNASWVVVFKALITTHHLMVHGHEVSGGAHTRCGRGFLCCCSWGGGDDHKGSGYLSATAVVGKGASAHLSFKLAVTYSVKIFTPSSPEYRSDACTSKVESGFLCSFSHGRSTKEERRLR